MAPDETPAAFHELLAALASLDGRFGDLDDQSVLEGYKWITSIFRVALDAYVWADPARPRFVDIVGPYVKWGGDNPDALRATFQQNDADLARRLRAATTWVREQAQIVPLALGEPNTVDEPYPVPEVTYGWAAGDAAYAMGSFDLGPEEALVIEGRSPACAFWNLCLWNPFLHTYNYDYERVTINGTQVAHEPDGSWTIVVAHS